MLTRQFGKFLKFGEKNPPHLAVLDLAVLLLAPHTFALEKDQ